MKNITLLTVILTIPSFFKDVYTRLYEDGQDPSNSYLIEYLSDARNSFNRFINNFYIIIGSSVLASIIDPEDPEKKADQVFSEFEESYRQFNSDLRRLLDGIFAEKERLSGGSGIDWDIAELISGTIKENRLNTDILTEWLASEDNPYVNNERVYYRTLSRYVKSFAKKELGLEEFSIQETMNDLLHSADQLAGVIGLASISLIGSMKVAGDRDIV
mgnify:CR=1 FL=1